MNARLILNGKEYEVEISEDQVSDIEKISMFKPKTGFEYGGFGMEFYVSDRLTSAPKEPAFSNEKLRDDYVRAINLFLKLSAWQALNDTANYGENWYEIVYGENGLLGNREICSIEVDGGVSVCSIKFTSKSKANEAIREFRDELEWYFAEFKPRLDV